MSSLAMLSAHLLRWVWASSFRFSLSLGVGKCSRKIGLNTSLGLHISLCTAGPLTMFSTLFVAGLWACASCLWPAHSLSISVGTRVHSVAGYPSGHCHLPRSLSLYLILFPFPETLFSQAQTLLFLAKGHT